MSEWQPIETVPEATWVLVYAPWHGDCPVYVGYVTYSTEKEDVLVAEKGNRRTYETRDKRVEEWLGGGWGGTHWMPLPSPPQQPEKP